MTSKMLLEQYMAERHALGFSLKTDEGCIRRFLQDFAELDDGEISFTKEYVLNHIGNRRNLQTNSSAFLISFVSLTCSIKRPERAPARPALAPVFASLVACVP